jgi:hypothetical protein
MSQRVGVNATGILFCMLALSAVAATDDCQVPRPPTFPSSIANQSIADTASGELDAYTQASAGYLKCLVAFVKSNESTLTDDELSALRSKYSAYIDSMREHTKKWNAIYGQFLENR